MINFANSQDELMEISEQEQKQILGGNCVYAGQTYSTGAVVTMGQDQKNFQCQTNGSWVQYDPARIE